MQLVTGPVSMLGRKVEAALREKGVGFDIVTVPFAFGKGYSPLHPEIAEHSLKGQVPMLIDGG